MSNQNKRYSDHEVALVTAMIVGLAFPALYHNWLVSIALAVLGALAAYGIVRALRH